MRTRREAGGGDIVHVGYRSCHSISSYNRQERGVVKGD